MGTQEQRDEFLGDVKIVKNNIMYYEKYEDLRRVPYSKTVWRWATLYKNMPEIAFLNKDKFIFVVVSHGCSLETFAHLNYGQRCNAGYCSTNLINNTFRIKKDQKTGIENRYWKNRFLAGKTNYYGYM